MQTKKMIVFCAAIIIMVLFKYSSIHAQVSFVRDSLYGSSLENNLPGDPVTRYHSDTLDQTDEGPTDIPAGKVSGTWKTEGSPYLVKGEVTIPNDSTLIIESGVNVIFTGHYKLNVQGRLLAIGNQQDTINFTAQDPSVGWHGIRFRDTPGTNDSSKIVYCSLKYGKANTGDVYDRCGGAILAKNCSKLVISNCLIRSNMSSGDNATTLGGAIAIISCSPVIVNNIISDNTAFENQGGAIGIAFNSDPVIRNNLICNNHATGGGAIFLYQSNPVLINNTIVQNHADIPGAVVCHGGAVCTDACSPQFFNTILSGNTATAGNQVNLQSGSQAGFHFCDIEGGIKSFSREMINGGSYNGVYENNIDSDPLFVDITKGDYHLMDNSPCISAGSDSVKNGSNWYAVPQTDLEGNSRPNPTGTIPDIGALENDNGQSITGIKKDDDLPLVKSQLYQNYPNPCSSMTSIDFSVPSREMTTLKVYDIQGQEVAVLVNEVKQPGKYAVTFNTRILPDGVYFYQLVAGSRIQTRKCLIMK